MNGTYRIPPVLSSRITYRALTLTSLALLSVFPAIAQKKAPWTWKDRDGKARTKADLDKIIKRHAEWLQSYRRDHPILDLTAAHSDPGADLSGAKLRGADLPGADLSDANLTDADLRSANLRGASLWNAVLIRADLASANLTRAHLENANLTEANLDEANLTEADLTEANLIGGSLVGADLTRTFLLGANLSGRDLTKAKLKEAVLDEAHLDAADLTDSDLTGAYLESAAVTGATFEPKGLPQIRSLASASGLELLQYHVNPDALAELRKDLKDGGFRDQERKITYALKRREAGIALETGTLAGRADYLFNRIFFDLTCQYGMSPARPLQLTIALWLVCSFVYLLFFIHLSKRSGLYLIPSPEFGNDEKDHATSPQRIRWQHGYSRGLRGLGSKAVQELRLLRTAMFFSLMSAFNIGFRDINFGRWLRLLTKREYDIKAVGWARPVSGLQSLISVYFIALWVLTYFGRPFE